MKYNTREVTNILDETFVGCFNGTEIVFEIEQKRALPSHIAEHVAIQLATLVYSRNKKKKEKKALSLGEIRDSILGPEIKTATLQKELTLAEEIKQHEISYQKFLEKKRREEILKVAENV